MRHLQYGGVGKSLGRCQAMIKKGIDLSLGCTSTLFFPKYPVGAC